MRGHRGKAPKIKSNRFKGVIATFRTQLTDLYNILESSQLHFVRCFKPNDSKAKDNWVDDVVSRQVRRLLDSGRGACTPDGACRQ